eukprot:jgi/Ulvmu1/2410/UM133_0011.1
MSSMIDEKAASVIGYEVVVKNKAGELVSGTVWNEDKQAGVIVLSSPATSGTPSLNDIIMLKTSSILEVISSKAPEQSDNFVPPRVDMDKVHKREARAIERMEKHLKSRGVGVSDHAQQLFDNMSKTMPCQWDGTTIEVFELVVLPEPYTVEAATFKSGCTANATIMERVRAVLNAELNRLDNPEASA